MKNIYISLLMIFLSGSVVYSQCPDNNLEVGEADASTFVIGVDKILSSTMSGGEAILVHTMQSGATYTFKTCGSTSFDTQITVYTTMGAYVAYNDDNCGLQSSVTFVSDGSDVLVLVDQYNCASNFSGNMTLLGTKDSGPSYCTPVYTNSTYEYITYVEFMNINNSTGSGTYNDYTSSVPPSDPMAVGETRTLTMVNGSVYSGDVATVYVDWNMDMDFDDAGESFPMSGGPELFNVDITVPATIPAGTNTTTMRVRLVYNSSHTACSSESYGEAEDYTITMVGAAPCSGTPTGGSASISSSDNCAATTATVSASGFESSTSGLSYLWEYSANGTSGWSSAGSTASSANYAPSSTTYYRYATTCSNSGLTGYSDVVQRTVATITSGGDVFTCGTGSVTLSASTNSGIVQWYAASSCCFTGSTGNTYSGTISSDLTRWAASSECTTTKVAVTGYVYEAPTADAGSDVSHCNGSSSVLSGSGTMNAAAIPSGYATSYATSTADTYISNVTFNSISTSTGVNVGSVETDNTSTVITVDKGSSYTLSITTADPGGTAYSHGIAAFIDWNRDGDFADPEETVYSTSSEVNVGTVSTTVNVPSGASEGDMMLRVVANEDASAPSATGSYTYGETEKYTVRVNATLTYSWSPSADLNNAAIAGPTASNTSTRTYTLTATAANGCTGTDDVVATVHADAVAGTVAVTNLSVSGNSDVTEAIEADAITWTNSGTANGDLRYWYQWTDNSGVSPSSGNWNSWVTDNPNTWNANSSGSNMNRTLWVKTITTESNGCGTAESSSTWINVRNCRADDITATPTAGTVANLPLGASITYDANFSDGAWERFQYQWNSSSGSWTDWTDATTDPHTWLADINGGQTLYVRSQITGVSVSGSPTCTQYSDPVQSYIIDCNADAVVLTNNEAGGATEVTCTNTGISVTASNADTYSWSDGSSTSATREFTSAGTYTVTGAKSNGCQTTSSITVTVNNTAPSVSLTNNESGSATEVTCTNTAISVTASGASTYTWSDGGSTSSSRDLTSAATYTVTGTDASNGCTDTDQITITVNNTAPTVGISNNEIGSPTEVTCTNTAITVTANGADTYSWSDGGASTAQRHFSSAATYTVTGTTTANGCTNTAQITITVNNTAPSVGITNNESGSATEVNCNNSGISVTATGADTYTWSDGSSTSASRDLTSAATYTVTGTTTANGCTNTAQITVTVDLETPAVTSASLTDATTCGVNTYDVTLTTSYGGVWSVSPADAVLFADNTSPNTTVTANPAASGFNTDITLTWTQGAGGCTGSTDDVLVKFNVPVESYSQDTDTYIWGGLTNTEWTTASNWYKWDGSRWAIQSSSYPGTSSKVIVLSNGNAGLCVSTNNTTTLTNSLSGLSIGSGASFDLGAQDLDITGDITVDGTLASGSGTISLVGSSAQTIDGSGNADFNNLLINNSNGVTVDVPVAVKNTLTMTSGNIANGSNVLTVGTSSLNVGTINYTSGNVTGKLRRYFQNTGNSKFFPVGSASIARDVTVTFLTGPGTNQYLTVSFESGAPQDSQGGDLYDGLPFVSSDGVVIQNVSNQGYWEINPTNDDYGTSINGKSYQLTCRMNNVNGVADYSKVRLLKSSGSNDPNLHHTEWLGLTHISNSGSNSDFTVTAGPTTGFSFFGGGGGGDNDLPVELISFNGSCNDGVVDLTWQTASEHNSSHYDVERSRDGVTWDVVNTQAAAGNSTELLTYTYSDAHAIGGDNYYRLTQVDIDGTEKTYDVINASCTETAAGYFSVFPNPSSGSFQVIMNNADLIGGATVNIVDTKGTVVLEKPIEVKTGINMFLIDQELAPGVYYINVTNGNRSTTVLRHSVK